MKAFKLFVIAGLLLISFGIQAQQCMILERVGSHKRVKFSPGDQLRFKVQNNDTIYEDQISALFDTAVAFGNKVVPYKDITHIWLGKENFWVSRLRVLSFAGGTFYFFLDSFNRLVNRDSPVVTKGGIIVLSSGVGLAGILSLTKKRWFRANKNHQIRYLDMTIG